MDARKGGASALGLPDESGADARPGGGPQRRPVGLPRRSEAERGRVAAGKAQHCLPGGGRRCKGEAKPQPQERCGPTPAVVAGGVGPPAGPTSEGPDRPPQPTSGGCGPAESATAPAAAQSWAACLDQLPWVGAWCWLGRRSRLSPREPCWHKQATAAPHGPDERVRCARIHNVIDASEGPA